MKNKLKTYIIQEKIDIDEYIDLYIFECADIRNAKKAIKEMRKNKNRKLRLLKVIY